MNINFTGVETPQVILTKRTEPTIGLFTITATKFSEEGTPSMLVTFKSDEDQSEFSHKFFLTPGALPRVQHLLSKFAGSTLNTAVTAEQLNMLLVNKKGSLVVDGERVTKDGKTNTYTTLRFSGFAETANNLTLLKSATNVRITEKSGTTTAPSATTDDLLAAGSAPAPTNDLPF